MSQPGPADLLSPSTVRWAAEILRWAHDYLAQPDPRLGRRGAICPFVPPALKENVFYIAVHEDVDDTTTKDHLEKLLTDYLDVFHRTPPSSGPGRLVKTILTAFPRMSAHRALVLDEVHARVKSTFVAEGMMIGQFHPLCASPAVRNATFKNKISPVPLFALRYIAAHDILFLGARSDWFEKYRSLYGEKYENRETSHDHDFAEIYDEARRKFTAKSDH